MSTLPSQSARQLRDYLMLFAKGMAMGAADIVPGVSGGTVAFITNIYDELLSSIRAVRPSTFSILYREGFAAFWRRINGNFLITLLAGIACSLLSLGRLISDQLDEHPIQLAAFFFGLIMASIVYMLRQQTHLTWREWVGIGLGAAVIVLLPDQPMVVESSAWWVFGAGALAICAMILPGISGSFILLLLGMYPVVLEALKNLDIAILAVFIAGCVAGLLSFSHFLGMLLRRFHAMTLAVLTGFLLGSLTIIWPWKEVLAYRVDRHGESVPLVSVNIGPEQFHAISGGEPHTLFALSCVVLGFGLVLGLERLASKTE